MDVLTPPTITPAELLRRLIVVAEHVLDPEPRTTVPLATLRTLDAAIDEAIKEARATAVIGLPGAPRRLIDAECAIMITCLSRIVTARADGDPDQVARWSHLARCFLPFLRTDGANAEAQR